MNIPDSMPTLSAGAHSPASGKACVMEYVSLLAGEPWTDTPRCTNEALAYAAQGVNDRLRDDERHALIPMIGRLFGTTDPVDLLSWMTSFMYVGALRNENHRLKPEQWDGVYRTDARLTQWLAEEAADGPGFLAALLDEYDRLAGRTEHRELTDADLADLASRVSA